MTIQRIWAYGTVGKAKGRVFEAKRNRNDMFVLHKKKPATTNDATNLRHNKCEVASLDEAWRLLQTDDYLINLSCAELKTRALRCRERVHVL